MADSQEITEAVCVHTRKIYDSCRDKDCAEDLRVYPTVSTQAYIDAADIIGLNPNPVYRGLI